MPSCNNIIVIGASAGGVEALTQLVKPLPPDIPAALFITVHFPPYGLSVLPAILKRSCALSAVHPENGEKIQPGRIYVAPPNHHLIIHRGYVELSLGPSENGHRPAIDTMFRSAARSYRQQVIGVILSGALDDGTKGLAIIKSGGGVAVVQDPDEALFDSMPRSAVENVEVDRILKLAEIPPYLNELVHKELVDEPISKVDTVTDEIDREADIVRQDKAAIERGERPQMPSTLTCPECGGVLWEINDGQLLRFRCHTGHAYSVDSLVSEQADEVDKALSVAVRALREKAALARRCANQAQKQNRLMSKKQFMQRAEEAEQQATLIQRVIIQQEWHKEMDESANGDGDGQKSAEIRASEQR